MTAHQWIDATSITSPNEVELCVAGHACGLRRERPRDPLVGFDSMKGRPEETHPWALVQAIRPINVMGPLAPALRSYIDWALKTFPDETLAQQALHLLKETKELEATPDSAMEKADVYMLASLITYRLFQTTTPVELAAAVWEKLRINKGRRWTRTPEGDYARIVSCPQCGGDLRWVAKEDRDVHDDETGKPVRISFKCSVCTVLFQRSEVAD